MKSSSPGLGVLRAVVVCCAAGAVVIGAAWSSAGRRAPPPLEEQATLFAGKIPLPPGAFSVMPVGDVVEVNGIAMRTAHFLVDMTPSEVVAFYVDAFASEGLDVDGTPGQRDGGGLVAWDHDSGIKRSITVFRQGEGSAVFPAVSAIEPQRELGSPDRPLPPGPTGARLVSDVLTRDGSRLSRTVTMMTPLGEEEAFEDLGRRLELAGYELGETRKTGAGKMIEAIDKAGREVVYTLTGGQEDSTGVIAVIKEM